jgi:hypothetical protein
MQRISNTPNDSCRYGYLTLLCQAAFGNPNSSAKVARFQTDYSRMARDPGATWRLAQRWATRQDVCANLEVLTSRLPTTRNPGDDIRAYGVTGNLTLNGPIPDASVLWPRCSGTGPAVEPREAVVILKKK